MTHIGILITIMISSGVLGGLTNYFLTFEKNTDQATQTVNLLKSILLSLCAAIAVPLLLSVLTNGLLDISEANPKTEYLPIKNYLVFSGFCILASFYSKRFMEDLYTRVNKVEQKADDAKKSIQNFEESKKEIDEAITILQPDMNSVTVKYSEEDFRKVIRSILSSSYSFRTSKGISKETNINENTVFEILETLEKLNRAERKTNQEGKNVWRIIVH